MATALTAFRSRVLPNVPMCPDIVVDEAVLDACIEFCEKTNIIRETLDPVTTTADQFQIDFDASPSTKIVQLMQVWCGVREIYPTQEDASGAFSYSETITGETATTGMPQAFSELSSGSIVTYPRPDKAYQLTARVSLKPSRNATVVHDDLYENWANVIAAGALYRLYTMKATWQDPQRASLEREEFRSGIGNAILESKRGRNRAEDMVTPVRI